MKIATIVLGLVVLCSCASTQGSSLEERSIREVLLANCIDTRYAVLDTNDAFVVVECDGEWAPWQSNSTSYEVEPTLKGLGIDAKAVARHGQSGVWESGFDAHEELESGGTSVFSFKIHGLTAKDKTYVILSR